LRQQLCDKSWDEALLLLLRIRPRCFISERAHSRVLGLREILRRGLIVTFTMKAIGKVYLFDARKIATRCG
jgi:hypothetical protein